MLSKRERIAAWVKTDAQRRAEAAVLAKVTARLKSGPAKRYPWAVDPAVAKLWGEAVFKAASAPPYFARFLDKGMAGDEVITDPFS